MKIQNLVIHKMFYETQWPRLLDINCSIQDAHIRLNGFIGFNKKRKTKLLLHLGKLKAHRQWMLKKQFGNDVIWYHSECPKTGHLKGLKGSGYKGEVKQYIYWYEDDKGYGPLEN